MLGIRYTLDEARWMIHIYDEMDLEARVENVWFYYYVLGWDWY